MKIGQEKVTWKVYLVISEQFFTGWNEISVDFQEVQRFSLEVDK
jgi:hypothetical protein